MIIQNRLEAETEYQLMVSKNRHDEMVICRLIKRICDGSTNVIVEDTLGNLVEAL